MRRRYFVIFNPSAGRSRRAVLDKVVAALGASGDAVEWCSATSAAAARAEAGVAARSGSYAAVVAAGGDGTIRQAAAAVADTDCPLGVVPLGTGNVLAHELELPRRDPAAIAAMLAAGHTVTVAMGIANAEPFLLMAGAGFDGRIVGGLDHGLKATIGKSAYVPPVLKALTLPLDQLHVEIDASRYTATWVVVCNARHYGGGFVLAPGTHVREPGLNAVLFHARSKPQLVAGLLALATGKLAARRAGSGDVSMIPCTHAQITSAAPVPTQIDGDAFATTPLAISGGGGRVRLIVPAGQ